MSTQDLQEREPLGRLVELIEELLENRRQQTPWMTLEQTAAYLHLSERSVSLAKDRGELPYSKQGRAVLFHRDHVDEWLLSQPTQRNNRRCRSKR